MCIVISVCGVYGVGCRVEGVEGVELEGRTRGGRGRSAEWTCITYSPVSLYNAHKAYDR